MSKKEEEIIKTARLLFNLAPSGSRLQPSAAKKILVNPKGYRQACWAAISKGR